MKRIALLSLLVMLFSCANKKSENTKELKKTETITEGKESDKKSRIEFETEMHDFGRIKAGEILVYTFAFINRGETKIILQKVEADCGCVEANFTKDPVFPEESGIIEAKFNSSGLYGKQIKTIEIQFNGKETKHLIIFADVENEQFEIK